jgi:hypothetical protein
MVNTQFVVFITCVWMNFRTNPTSKCKAHGTWFGSLRCHQKLKNIIYRICRNCLPTRTRLRDKGVNCTAICALCNMNEEDNIHLLFHCPSNKNIWSMWNAFPMVCNLFNQNHAASNIIFQMLTIQIQNGGRVNNKDNG